MYRRYEDPPWEGIAPRRSPRARRRRRPGVATAWARDPSWLREVAQTPERDLRGHRIALTYHALAIDLYQWIYDVKGVISQDDIVGQVPRVNANWFNFGTWATATLNADIRNDDPPYRSDRLVPPGFYRRLTPTVLAVKSANRQRYNQLLTWYQRMVFINTTYAYSAMRRSSAVRDGGAFAEILDDENIAVDGEIQGHDTPEDPPAWMREAQALVKPYDGTPVLGRERHLRPVAMACEYYRRAREITLFLKSYAKYDERKAGKDPDAIQQYFEYLRARLIFLANLIITSTEQDLVNPGVERVLNNVPTAATDYVSNHLSRFAQRSFGVPRQLAGLRIPVKLQPAEDAFKQVWARLLTRELLVLALPAETLRLGRDIPPLAAGEPFFPKELFDLRQLPCEKNVEEEIDNGTIPEGYVQQQEDHCADNLNLMRTVAAFDRSQGDGCGTAARDWRQIAQRLNWATTLIRTRMQDASLFWPPFRNEDVERIYRGKLPLHSGNPTDFDVLGPLESFHYLCGPSSQPDEEAE